MDFKTYYVVAQIIFEEENKLEELMSFVRQNKGNAKMQKEVAQAKIMCDTCRYTLKKLYRIQNSLYGV